MERKKEGKTKTITVMARKKMKKTQKMGQLES
jgi:hypothetical protein